MAHLVIHPEDPKYNAINGWTWEIGAFPRPEGGPDERPTKVATERMLWRHDGSLCVAPGKEFFVEDEPRLITHDEWMREHST